MNICDDCGKKIEGKIYHRYEVINDDNDYEIDELDYEYYECDLCEECKDNL